jgi:hypothetical protein
MNNMMQITLLDITLSLRSALIHALEQNDQALLGRLFDTFVTLAEQIPPERSDGKTHYRGVNGPIFGMFRRMADAAREGATFPERAQIPSSDEIRAAFSR